MCFFINYFSFPYAFDIAEKRFYILLKLFLLTCLALCISRQSFALDNALESLEIIKQIQPVNIYANDSVKIEGHNVAISVDCDKAVIDNKIFNNLQRFQPTKMLVLNHFIYCDIWTLLKVNAEVNEFNIIYERLLGDVTIYIYSIDQILLDTQTILWGEVIEKKESFRPLSAKISLPTAGEYFIVSKINTKYIPNIKQTILTKNKENNFKIFSHYLIGIFWIFTMFYGILLSCYSLRNKNIFEFKYVGIFLILISTWSLNLDYRIFTPSILAFEAFTAYTQFLSQVMLILFFFRYYSCSFIKLNGIYLCIAALIDMEYLIQGSIFGFLPEYGVICFALVNIMLLLFIFTRQECFIFKFLAFVSCFFLCLRFLSIYVPILNFLCNYVAYSVLNGTLLILLGSIFLVRKNLLSVKKVEYYV